jgi:hypothetical protein
MASTGLQEFGYLLDKIEKTEFSYSPFKALLINDFLSKEHFDAITGADEINRPVFDKTEKLIDDLIQSGYKVQPFPGCTTSIKDYLSCYNMDKWPVDKTILEGFGITFRLLDLKTPLLARFYEFLGSAEFKACLEKKFGLPSATSIDTGIQKYLDGYEISPHPDIRRKALTYMLNINTSPESEKTKIHTYLLKFKPEREYLTTFWKHNQKIDRCWVPWSWCDIVEETNLNNCIVIFAPSDDTMHAVKLDYDHLKFQRTQVYGNLWHLKTTTEYTLEYNDVDLLKIKKAAQSKKTWKQYIPGGIKRALRRFK